MGEEGEAPVAPDRSLRIPGLIGKNLRAARTRQGLSQQAVADRMYELGATNWGQTTCGDIERGKRQLTAEELVGLCIVLELRPNELLLVDPAGPPIKRDLKVGLGIGTGAEVDIRILQLWLNGHIQLKYVAEPQIEVADDGTEWDDEIYEVPKKRSGQRARRSLRVLFNPEGPDRSAIHPQAKSLLDVFAEQYESQKKDEKRFREELVEHYLTLGEDPQAAKDRASEQSSAYYRDTGLTISLGSPPDRKKPRGVK